MAAGATVAALQALAFAPGALAATTVSFQAGKNLHVFAASGVDNHITVNVLPSSELSIVDSADTVEVAGTDPTCRDGDERHQAICRPTVDIVTIDLLDGTDSAIVNAGVASRLNGGTGRDLLVGGPRTDLFNGGPGPDTFEGKLGVDTVTYADRSTPIVADIGGPSGADGAAGEGDTITDDVENLTGGRANDVLTGDADANVIDGGDGSDVLDGDLGPDRLIGGDGERDRVTYAGRSASVSATLNGLADDGEAVEGDAIDANVEDLTGGDGADVLTGDDVQGNHLDGGPGNDRLEGRDGPDVLDGGAGGDVMVGGAGIDAVTYRTRTASVTVTKGGGGPDGEAGEGDDVRSDVEEVHGGLGDDNLTGSPGSDMLYGHEGDDTLSGLAGPDSLIGGEGANTLDGGLGVDVCDDVAPGCEQLTDSDPFPGGDPGPIGPLPV
jgi:Ca2+-binding RTX toxin-like protein